MKPLMPLTQSEYAASAQYEIFLLRALKYDKGIKNPSNQELVNLIDAEKGAKFPWLPSHEKQMTAIRQRLATTITCLEKQALAEDAKTALRSLLPEVETAKDSQAITIIVQQGLAYTREFIA